MAPARVERERLIARTFCDRAAARVRRRLDQIESSDDAAILAIADLAYDGG